MDWIYICDNGFPKDLDKPYIWSILKNDGTIVQKLCTTKTIQNLYNIILKDAKRKPSYNVYAYKELGDTPPFKTIKD